MTRPTGSTRRRLLRLAPMLGLVLLVGFFAGGAHRHADGPGHPCAACTVAHSAAAPARVVSPAVPPEGSARAILPPVERAPRESRLETAPSRAPPRD